MTPAQLTALRAACLADSGAQAFFAAPGDAAGLLAYLNGARATNVWRTDAPVNAIIDAITWTSYTPLDAVAATDPQLSQQIARLLTIQTKQMNLQLMLQGRDTINAARPNVRGGLRDAVVQIPSGAGGANTAPGGSNGSTVLAACVRPGTRAEVFLAEPAKASDTTPSGGGANSTTARVMTFEGAVEETEARALIFRDDGTIWS